MSVTLLLICLAISALGQQFITVTNGIGNSPYFLALEISPHEDTLCGESIASGQILKPDGSVYVASKNSYLNQGTVFTLEFDWNGTTTFDDHLPLTIRLILNTADTITLTDILPNIASSTTFTSDQTFCGTREPTAPSTAPSLSPTTSPTLRPLRDSDDETVLVDEQIDDDFNDANTDSTPMYVWILIALGGVAVLCFVSMLCLCAVRKNNGNTKRATDDNNDFVKTPTEDKDDGEDADEAAQGDDYWTAQKKSLDAEAEADHKRSVSLRTRKAKKSRSPSPARESVILDIPQRENRVPSQSASHLDVTDDEDDALMKTDDSDREAAAEVGAEAMARQATHSATGTMVTYENPKMIVAKPEDYDEIRVEPVDAIDHKKRSSQKKGFHIEANVVAVGPTRASALSSTEPPKLSSKAKAKPSRQNSSTVNLQFSTLRNKIGVLESAPTHDADGWISADAKMFSVTRSEFAQCDGAVSEGFPVQFDVVEDGAVNLRRISKMDAKSVAQCVSNKGATTTTDAKFMIEGTAYDFGGDLSRNHCVAVDGALEPRAMAARMEQCINAFVNTDGGSLFVGLGDGGDGSWAVRGVATKALDLAALKRAVMDRVGMFEPFNPKLVESITEFRVLPILKRNGEVVEGLAVLRVGVAGPFVDESGERMLFATADGQKFRKNFNYITSVVM